MTIAEPTFPISEIYGPVFQGEGSIAGLRTMFVRFGGCDSRCSWCDSMYAVEARQSPEPWERLTASEIADRLAALSDCGVVTFSGGNPCLYDLSLLVERLATKEIWVETQGTIYQPWLASCNVTVSPKPPSAYDYDLDKLLVFMVVHEANVGLSKKTVMKIPIDPAQPRDFEFAVRMANEYEEFIDDFTFSVVSYPSDTLSIYLDRWRAVEELVRGVKLKREPRVLPQLHVVARGHQRGI